MPKRRSPSKEADALDALADETRVMAVKLQVAELLRSGMHPAEIAEELSITSTAVHAAIEEVYSHYSAMFAESSERLQLTILSRYEHLYQIAEAFATGKGTWVDSTGKRKRQYAPDRHWMKVGLDILKAEGGLLSELQDRENDRRLNKVVNDEDTSISKTITSTDDMYNTAMANMDDEWRQVGVEMAWADLDAEDLMQLNEGPPAIPDEVHPEIDDLQKRIDALAQALPGDAEDDDDGENG